MSEDLTVVFTATDAVRVRQLKSLLEQEGIAVRVLTDDAKGEIAEGPFVLPNRTSLAVDRRDADVARRIASEFEEAAGGHPASEGLVDESEPPPVRPVCPSCARERNTACPVCGSSGSANFYDTGAQLSDGRDAKDAPMTMLVCQTCDEAFVPEYPRRCEWCGHDFGEGTEIDEDLQIDGGEEPMEMANVRVIATVIALAALLLCVAAYFAVIF